MSNKQSDERKTVIITGASRGIGHATANHFLDRTGKLYMLRSDTPPECKRDPNWTHHIPTDLVDSDSIRNFIEKALEALDGSHCMRWNNAGFHQKHLSKNA